MEFQFGTNWARFSQYSGGVIATTLAMEGVFAFFLESSFLGIFLFGERRFGPKIHWLSALMVFLGSWLSGFFIIVTDAWMQHPVGFTIGPDGTAHLQSFWALLLNEWAFWQYLHNMGGAVITGSFAMAAVGRVLSPVRPAGRVRPAVPAGGRGRRGARLAVCSCSPRATGRASW